MDDYIKQTQQRLAEIEGQLEQLKQEKQQHSVVKEKKGSKVPKDLNSVRSTERSVPLERFQSSFEKINFKMRNLTKKAAEFEHEEYKEFVYLLDRATPTVAIHPSLVEQTKMLVEVPNKQVKSTALRRFPKKEEEGKFKSNFGYTYTFQTKSELEVLLVRVVDAIKSRSIYIGENG